LIGGGAPASAVEAALLLEATEGLPFIHALVEQSPALRPLLERELGRSDAPTIHWVRALPELVAELPPGLCQRLLAVPVHRDVDTGRVDVAAVDTLSPHVAAEFGYQLQCKVRVLRAELDQIRLALSNLAQVVSAESTQHISSVPPATPLRPSPLPTAPPIPLIRRPSAGTPRARDVSDFPEPILPLSRSKLKAAEPVFAFELELEQALLELGQADSPELVARWICRALEPAISVVFALRSGMLEPRAAGRALGQRWPRQLPLGEASVFDQALRSGFYLGPLPVTFPHVELRAALPPAAGDEVYCAPVIVGARPVLLALLAEAGPSLVATRRADRVVAAAAAALERILVTRKRGGGGKVT